jgi:6-phosphogluconolactonase (cycloisomerase 2 family)
MKRTKKGIAIAISMLVLASCQKDRKLLSENDVTIEAASKPNNNKSNEDEGSGKGHVYTLSNQISENKVIDYRRAANGSLTLAGSFSTGGIGTGGGLGNQGAIILGQDGGILLAVNPGSNSISSLKITGGGLNLKSIVHSGGIRPVSITQHGNIVFVLNAGGHGNISGFILGNNDKLQAIPHSTRPLSAINAGAAQISFINNGKVLVITEKATNKITTYTVNEWGIPGAMHTHTSAKPTPFGFAVGRHGNIFVSEAVGGAPGASVLTSYNISNNGAITLVDGPVEAGQSAACWVVITGNEKYAFTTNTANDNLSTFNVNTSTGSISVLHAIAATTAIGPIEAALDNNSKFLYVLNSGSNNISVYAVADNGSLSSVQTLPGVPAGATGLAAK